MPVSTECAAALLSFRYPSCKINDRHFHKGNYLKTILPNGRGNIPRDLMTTKRGAKVRKGASWRLHSTEEKMEAHMKFSRQDIHSLVFSNPELYNSFGVICLCPTLIAELRAVGNFCQMVLVIFWAPKTGTGLSCTIYEIPVKFSLSQDMKPHTIFSQTNGTEKFRSFR